MEHRAYEQRKRPPLGRKRGANGVKMRNNPPRLKPLHLKGEPLGIRRSAVPAAGSCSLCLQKATLLQVSLMYIRYTGCPTEWTALAGTAVRTALCLSRARRSSASAPANLRLGEPIARHVTCSDPNRQLLGWTHLITVRTCLNGAGERGVEKSETACSACLLVSW